MFYVIEDGDFTIYDNKQQELARVGKSSCFGELALLRQVPWDHATSLFPAESFLVTPSTANP